MDALELEQKLIEIGERLPRSIFHFSDGTNATEWNVAFHFAVHLHAVFDQYDCDFDLSKVHEAKKYKRPDIVLHKRGRNDDNFLVVEMKVRNTASEIAEDAEKICGIWFPNYNYRFGATVLVTETTCSAQVYQNPQFA